MMIDRIDGSRLLAILQTDHSRTAGFLAAHWGNDRFATLTPYASMVIAAQEHDSGWWDWEMRPTLTQDGHPIDYQGSTRHLGPTKLRLYRSAITRVAEIDAYAGYIVLLHNVGLLTQGGGLLPRLPDFSRDPGVREFLDEQEERRLDLLDRILSAPDTREYATDEWLAFNYKMMEVFDQFAQFFCNRYPFNSPHRTSGPTNTLTDAPIPVRPGLPDTRITIDIRDETTAVVRPYPFDVDPLVIMFEGRVLPDVAFPDQDAFLRAFYTAERLIVRYELRGD